MYTTAVMELQSDLDLDETTENVAEKITNIQTLGSALDPAREVTEFEMMKDMVQIVKFLGTGDTDRSAALTVTDLPKADMEYLSYYEANDAGTDIKSPVWTSVPSVSESEPEGTFLVRFHQFALKEIYTLPVLNAYFIFNGDQAFGGPGFLSSHDLLPFDSPTTYELITTWENEAANPGGNTEI